MLVAASLSALDALAGLLLLVVAHRREQKRPEVVMVLGVFLVLVAIFLAYVAGRVSHRPVVIVRVPTSGGVA